MIRIFMILEIRFEVISIPGLTLFATCEIIRVFFCDIFPFMSMFYDITFYKQVQFLLLVVVT